MCALLWQYANKSSGEVPFGTWTGKAATATGILEQRKWKIKMKKKKKKKKKLKSFLRNSPPFILDITRVQCRFAWITAVILCILWGYRREVWVFFWFGGWKNGCDVQFKLGAWREWNITVSHVGEILLLKQAGDWMSVRDREWMWLWESHPFTICLKSAVISIIF